jgi:macrodomain Ter protein organizer (MatP/YcbG family)
VDVTKWKSVTVPIDVWNTLKKRAEQNDRSVAKEIAHMVKNKTAEDKAA